MAAFGVPLEFPLQELYQLLLAGGCLTCVDVLRCSQPFMKKLRDVVADMLNRGSYREAIGVILAFDLQEAFPLDGVLSYIVDKVVRNRKEQESEVECDLAGSKKRDEEELLLWRSISKYVEERTPCFSEMSCPSLAERIKYLAMLLWNSLKMGFVEHGISWYHANRMLSFYAPGWCGEVRDVIYNDNGKVTVVYRVTIRGIDGEVHREAAGTASLSDARLDDPVAAAEEAAFCKACARFGFGLYLYHEDEFSLNCKNVLYLGTEVHREAAGTASLSDARLDDPVAAAEEAAFCKACARLGFGLYLYYEDEVL
uniref:FRIGIDA-like protein n=1 Tax=Aegilops tauschii TaxID=37682 RepID=N1QY63_AEGTA